MSKRERAARVGVALASLAASKHYKLDDLSITVYDRVLADVRVDDIEAVCRGLEKDDGPWMPKPGEIRAAAIARARKHYRDTLLAQVEAGDVPAPYCAACNDTGWEPTPGRRAVEPCGCRRHNPRYQLRIIGD